MPAGPPKTMRGKMTVTDNCKWRSMPRRFTAFVLRLHFDISADYLSEFLEAAGMINPTCKRLEATNGRRIQNGIVHGFLRGWLEGHLL